MIDDPTLQSIIDRILVATPARAIDAALAPHPELLAEVDQVREVFGTLGLELDPVAPSEAARARFISAVAALPVVAPRAALLVVDMLVDHLTPGAALEVPRARDLVPAMVERLARARAVGQPIIYLCDHHEPGDPELYDWPQHNTADPRASVWPELAPAADDVVIPHRHFSAFSGTNLDATLRAAGVTSLELTGCITEIHLYATAIDAFQRGYQVSIPPDLSAGTGELVEQVVLGVLGMLRPIQADIPR